MEWAEVIELARRSAEPAVTILLPVEQPVVAHPDTSLRLRDLIGQALDIVESWWGSEAAAKVRSQLDQGRVELESREHAHGLAVLSTPDECRVLHLPFTVDEQVVVNQTFATRQLFEGLARQPRYRVLVLAGHHAELFEGRGDRLVRIGGHGFPLETEPPHEWDTPHKDLPIHDEAEKEEHRIVHRAVDAALAAASAAEPLPVVVTAAERELAFFDEVTSQPERLVGRVHGNFARSRPTELAAAVRPAVEAHMTERRHRAVEGLREAYGRGRAVTGLPDVQRAAGEGRGHELVVEEGFTVPRHWLDDLTPGDEPDVQLNIDDMVDDVIETVLLAGGEVEFVEPGALEDFGHVGLILRY